VAAARAGIGIDVGGTKIAAGVIGPDGTVGARSRRDTPAADADAIARTIAEVVEELDAPGAPVGVGAAGHVDLEGVVRTSPNVPGWVREPLQARLEQTLEGRPVVVANDADAAAWGEYRCGGAADVDGLVLLTVGTGVGGGVVIGDRLLRGADGGAGEVGHLIVDEGGPRCNCGNLGCLEAHASGTAIGRKARAAVAEGRVRSTSPLSGRAPGGAEVSRAALDGDPDAREIIAEAGRWLGVGLGALGNVLDPPVFVIGGGVMAAGELLLAPAREAMVERLLGRETRAVPPVRASALGSDAGMIGAGLLAGESTAPRVSADGAGGA